MDITQTAGSCPGTPWATAAATRRHLLQAAACPPRARLRGVQHQRPDQVDMKAAAPTNPPALLRCMRPHLQPPAGLPARLPASQERAGRRGHRLPPPCRLHRRRGGDWQWGWADRGPAGRHGCPADPRGERGGLGKFLPRKNARLRARRPHRHAAGRRASAAQCSAAVRCSGEERMEHSPPSHSLTASPRSRPSPSSQPPTH